MQSVYDMQTYGNPVKKILYRNSNRRMGEARGDKSDGMCTFANRKGVYGYIVFQRVEGNKERARARMPKKGKVFVLGGRDRYPLFARD